MKAIWTSHLKDPKEIEDFKVYVKNSSALINRLSDILEAKLDAVERPKKTDYDCPSWAYEQADRNGQVRTLLDILEILDLKGN